MESEEVGCEYLAFESLMEIEDSLDVIIALFHSEQWKENFQGLNLLRRVNKYRRAEVPELFQHLLSKICVFVDSPRSALAKNALFFISECFSTFNSYLVPLALQLTQLLLVKSINEKSFIRIEAVKALTSLSDNYYSDEQIVEIFKGNCYHKSPSLSKNAFTHLNKMLGKIDTRLSFRICLELENCKRQGIIEGAKAHLKLLSTTWPDFQQTVSTLNEREKQLISTVMNEKAKRQSLKEALDSKKIIRSYNSAGNLLE